VGNCDIPNQTNLLRHGWARVASLLMGFIS